ncbi:pilus retraction protein PilT [Xenococcus sp. PCC 7305]|uniref:type IV pilus twitching motility protein PilT n=1 Tax=Xenococcus sp. PCC 7305 TaxID=102125 RepID=UPI0002AC0054|nr:type IV pilus twitching motility protein PilT [Xenococcus sp. PCC 7305]ELS01580.1 pilus retraction protein PilT [Xenococcus sp. PCC 7305]
MEMMIEDLMEQLVEMGGSDMHIQASAPVYFRISGKLTPIGDDLMPAECQRLIFSMLNNTQRKDLEQTWELDCSYGVKGLARFRVNVYKERGCYAACLRALSSKIPNFDQLGLPEIVREMTYRPKGLILVTGPTGSGKTTTLAAMLDLINRTRAEHILTVEDPIEYVFPNHKSLFHQRQKGEDTKSFANALKGALREDPDIILVGEMRDLETISLAISAAETGHLVFGTLHTSSASGTVDRMVDVFPAAEQAQIRAMLSNSLIAVFSQTLAKKKSPKPGEFGRVMAQEIMIVTPAIANLIREGKASQVYSALQTGGKLGMQTMEQALAHLVRAGVIDIEEAIGKSGKPDELQRLVAGAMSMGTNKARSRR